MQSTAVAGTVSKSRDERDRVALVVRPCPAWMMGWADGYGWMGPGWIFMILFWALVIVGGVALVRWIGTRNNSGGSPEGKTPQKRRDLER